MTNTTLCRVCQVASVGLLFQAVVLNAQPTRISEPINEAQRVELRGNVSPGAQPVYDQGAVEPSFSLPSISLLLKPSAQQQSALAILLRDQQDPSSPDYHRWLTPEQYADRFALNAADIGKIQSWLQSLGFRIIYTARARNWIGFTGTAAQVQRAFGTQIHRYQVGGEMHFANATDPFIPAALADVVAGLRGLDDFRPKPPARKPRPLAVRPAFTSYGDHYLAPDDIATIYDLNPLFNAGINGTGQKLVIVGQTDIILFDITSFRSLFNLPANAPQLVLYGSDPGTNLDDLMEADLDLEWSGAVARNATIYYVYSTNVFDSLQYAIDQDIAPVISMSYGGCEQANLYFLGSEELVAQQANAEGITWFASSGDSGAAGCDASSATWATQGLAVNFPASIPEVTAVGGAEFYEGSGNYWSSSNGPNGGSALSYIPEMGWNDNIYGSGLDTALSSTGGGVSIYYPTPAWQSGAGFPNDNFRDVPDVSLTASADHDGYLICTQYNQSSSCPDYFLVIGGTSASAPAFAGITTLLNHYLVSHGIQAHAGLGNMNPKLYSLYPGHASAFHDITTGSNIVPCQIGTPNCTTGYFGYSAGTGYDHVTGLGSVDAFNLVSAWAGAGAAPTVTTSAASAVTSSSATLNGSVNPNGSDTQAWFTYWGCALPCLTPSTAQQNAGAGTSAAAFSANVTGLTANTTYYFQAWASNSAGTVQGSTLNFTTSGSSGPYTISGQVTYRSTPLAGVRLTLGGGKNNSATTDSSGNYIFAVAAGNYTVTPFFGGYTFSPSSQSFSGLTSSQVANFTASRTAIGNFNGDGYEDLVWQNMASLQTNVNYYGGAGPQSQGTAVLNNSAGLSAWNVVGAGDFNRDGVADLVWQNTGTGQVNVNYYGGASGTSIIGFAVLNSGAGTGGWSVVAVADVNADGVPDLIWQKHSTGQVNVNYYGGAGGSTLTGYAVLNTGAGTAGWSVVAAADFDANGTPDLVWQNAATGQVNVNYYGGPGGSTFLGWALLDGGAGTAGWTVRAAADMNADGIPDLIWVNTSSGQAVVNFYGGAGGATYKNAACLNCGASVAGVRLGAVADYNRNGAPDLVWQNTTTGAATVTYYGFAGAVLEGYNVLNTGAGAAGWKVVASGDFNSDGIPDLVWQKTSTGQVNVNYYGGPGGATITGYAVLNSGAGTAGWSVVGAADFNSDGVPDLIWQKTSTGQVNVNYYGGAGGATLIGYAVLNSGAGTAGWHVVGAADFDGNGTPDLLWQNTATGQVNVNYYSGSLLTGYAVLNNGGGTAGWTVAGAADFDGNGVPDLVWQNTSSAQVTVNYYGGARGAVLKGWNWLNSSSNPGWRVMPARSR
jgi:Pro-kumamolisin, activation domain/FG-GAP-like repeat